MLCALVNDIQLTKQDTVVEFCAGQGALTRHLMTRVHRLYVIELDDRFITKLQDLAERSHSDPTNGTMHVIHADVVHYDLGQHDFAIRVIGNLAYNISAPVLLHCLHQNRYLTDAHFMLQKEVALRLSAQVGDKEYGRLAAIMQIGFEVDILRGVPPDCFVPRPAVQSSFVRLRRREKPRVADDRILAYEEFVRRCFAMRRKYLLNNLSQYWPDIQQKDLDSLGIPSRARAENVCPDKLIDLFNYLHS